MDWIGDFFKTFSLILELFLCIIEPFRTQINFFRNGWIEIQGTKVRNTGNVGDSFKFVYEVQFN
jgi:hypothetical protein